MTIDAAVRELREDLLEIAAVTDCGACECLLAVAAQALADVRRIPGDEARDAEDDLRRLLRAVRDGDRRCLGCDDCLAAESYRRFRGSLAALGAGAPPGAASPLGAASPGLPPDCAGCDCAGCD